MICPLFDLVDHMESVFVIDFLFLTFCPVVDDEKEKEYMTQQKCMFIIYFSPDGLHEVS